MTFPEIYLDLFAGTPNSYAIRREWEQDGELKSAYLPSDYSKDKEGALRIVAEVTQDIGSTTYGLEAVKAHLNGTHFLGVYPIHSDSTVKFFALDFDKVEAEARKEAVRQQFIFRTEAGIPTYIERSRSGNGYHLWGFLEHPVNAGKLRHALGQFIEDAATYDRMFPNQDGCSEVKPYGNLIALPLNGALYPEGKTAFVEIDEDGNIIIIDDQLEYVRDMVQVPTATIERLFQSCKKNYEPDLGGKTRKVDPEGLEGIYKVVHPKLGCEWVRWAMDNPTDVAEPEWYALACQFAQLEGGREMFHKASENDPRYNGSATDAKFDQALEKNSPHRCATIRGLNGPDCTCDTRYAAYGVTHPFDLARIPFIHMLETLKEDDGEQDIKSGFRHIIDRTRAIFKNPKLFKGHKYGWDVLDEFTELRPQDLVICAARPGRGKTAFMIDVAYRLLLQDVPVMVFSMEMSREQFFSRMVSRASAVDGKRIHKGTVKGKEWRRMLKAYNWLYSDTRNLIVNDTIYDAQELVNRAAEFAAEHPNAVIMIDYLQMATNLPGESLYEKNSRLPRQYKLLAKGMDVTVFCLAQMNREGEDLTEESETIDSVLEGSGKIEQYADVILYWLGLRRPGIVRRTLVVHKERHREAGHKLKFDFNQPIMCFEPEHFWSSQAAQINATTPIRGREFFV